MIGLILICALSVARPDCDKGTALRYERSPGVSELPLACFHDAQTWAAEHVAVREGEYMKVVCSRHEFGAQHG